VAKAKGPGPFLRGADPELLTLLRAVRAGIIEDDYRQDQIINNAIHELQNTFAVSNNDPVWDALADLLRSMGIEPETPV
jgi:hypothetical protein